MANPPTAKAFDQPVDPSDIVDFFVIVSQTAPDARVPGVLLLGEGVARYALALTAEAAALGLKISQATGYENRLSGNVLQLWLEVETAMQSSPLFDGAGVTVAIELLIVTTSTPPRTKQRSFLVRIANQ